MGILPISSVSPQLCAGGRKSASSRSSVPLLSHKRLPSSSSTRFPLFQMALLLTLPELSSTSGATICIRRRWVAGSRSSRILRVSRRSLCACGKMVDLEASVVRVSDQIRNAGFDSILSIPVLCVSSASPPPPSLRHQLQQMEGGDDKKDYYLNVGNAIRTLREDYPIIFYKEPGFSIYRDDIVFKDPLNTFVGIDNYKQIFSALRFIGQVLFKVLWVDIVSVWQPAESTIMIRWTVHGIRRLPWESHGRFDGISVYKLDRKGKIFEHQMNNIARNPPTRFKILAVEELIQSLGSSSTPKPTYFETSLTENISGALMLGFLFVGYYFVVCLPLVL
ncbi:uncharacterized protein LOC110092122 [Dendrobium catenatum]|uniref:Uncharacterized protein n=1 Tax=Dendrobium catenatum TaxID=906689 RepID=A0A2I0VUF8_9ASPA|nr:uncharacterized protein LOC110092122 [Dendrobium catenatum]PKU67058.1 hypothetical protein MA16_Dca008847 [Dendrobium catenatum]